MRHLLIMIIILFGCILNAQEVQKDGKTYEVKKDKIFLDGKDITATLSIGETASILESAHLINQKMALKEKAEKEAKKTERETEKLEREIRKAEKAQKRAEKEQRQAEKELKKQQRAQDKFDRANKDYADAQKKYEKLKRKGKLSPNDELEWLEKLKNLKADIEKAKNRM